MKKYFVIVSLYIKLLSGIVHEEPPFYIPAYPTIFEISTTNGEVVSSAYLLFRNSHMDTFRKKVMECNEKRCKAIIPRQKPDSNIYYQIVVRLCSGKKLKTKILTLHPIPLPEWQQVDSSDYIYIDSPTASIEGFWSENIILNEPPHQQTPIIEFSQNMESQQESQPKLKTKQEELPETKESIWDFFSFDDEESSDEVEEPKTYKEIFIP
ncbi:MAG TPA: hypothetical protein EYO61_05900 [Campylobacterales bacterium]|nr:hypothetical protein [Campylobacterales bacterium]